MIIHIDMDAFYASVEVRDAPHLKGKPVIVGGSPQGRGVVAAASYEARKFGVHSAMSAHKALQLCPQAVVIRPRMDHYVAISRQIREIFFRYTPLVEPLSLDEAFLDVTGSESLFGKAPDIARMIKREVSDELGLTASAGVATNKFIAKVASDFDKPDGLVVVEKGTEQEFLDPLSIRRVWGIGPKTAEKFSSLGVSTVAGIRGLPKDILQRMFGLNSDHFWRLSRGLDTRPVVPEREAKSISHESTFNSDIQDHAALRAWCQELAGQVSIRMRRRDIKAKTFRIKVRFSDFRTITRSKTLPDYTFSTKQIEQAATELLDQVFQETNSSVRLLGVAAANLNFDVPVQQSLFDQDQQLRDARIDATCDLLKEKFGTGVVRPAAAMQHQIRMRRNPTDEDRLGNED